MTAPRRAAGFTLIELLVSLALAGMVVAGALQLHSSFNTQSRRQQEIGDIQQTLRVSMLVLERAVRTSGAGFGGTLRYIEPNDQNVCGAGPINHFAFEWSNSNTYADPITTYWTVGNNDTDPDWFRVVATDQATPVLTQGDVAGKLVIFGGNAGNFLDHDLFQIITPAGSCTREVSTGGAHGGDAGLKYLLHDSAAQNRCFNPLPANETCITTTNCGDGTGANAKPCPLRHIASGGSVFRVDTSVAKTPKLTTRTAPFGTPFSSATYPWTVIAENIEDLQIALIMKDGSVCNNNDNPFTICSPATAVAVRLTLVGRGSSSVSGLTTGQTGGYEDRPGAAVTDGYLRRALTTEIQLRNNNP